MAILKGKKTEQCPNCGLEREKNFADDPEPIYTCVECGKQGFDCCVAGTHTICNECDEGSPEDLGDA